MISLSRADGFFLCHTCKVRHPCLNQQNYLDKLAAHQGHATSFINRDWAHERGWSRLAAWDPRKLLISAFGLRDVLRLREALEGYAPNADVKAALQAAQTMTVTNLHSLASSATAGWQSDEVNNTSNLYLDTFVQAVIDFANTAPANSKGIYWFLASGLVTGKLSNPFSGSEGTLTLIDVTTTPQVARLLGFQPYTTTDEVSESSLMSVAAPCAGIHPNFWAVGAMNHSGAALAGSGNTVKYTGVYATVI